MQPKLEMCFATCWRYDLIVDEAFLPHYLDAHPLGTHSLSQRLQNLFPSLHNPRAAFVSPTSKELHTQVLPTYSRVDLSRPRQIPSNVGEMDEFQ